MLSEKIPVNINFAHGVDTKSDPKQVPIGRFLELVNSVFTKTGLLQKRPGYPALTTLPNTTARYLTTFNGNLTAIGSTIQAYAPTSNPWIDKGSFTPLSFSAVPVVRSALSQTQCDSVVAINGLVCTVYTEQNGNTKTYGYVVQDSVTGQNISSPTTITPPVGTASAPPRVFLLGGYFIVMLGVDISGLTHLQYFAISTNDPATVTDFNEITDDYFDDTFGAWDGVVSGNRLFISYCTDAGGLQIQVTYLDQNFVVAAPVSFSGSSANEMGMFSDTTGTTPTLYTVWSDDSAETTNICAVDFDLNKQMDATQVNNHNAVSVTGTAQNGIATVVFTRTKVYSYAAIETEYVNKVDVTLPLSLSTGTVGGIEIVARSVGLASKAFLIDETTYFLTAYDNASGAASPPAGQQTFFLMDLSGNVISRIAYQNGGGYLVFGLPQAQVVDSTVYIAYLFKDLILPVNKSQGAAAVAGVYSQTGVNLGAFEFSTDFINSAEIGQNLNLSGGMTWAYDGNTLNEQGFHLYPDSVYLAVSHSGGDMTTQDYFYQVIYQWTDAQGNIFNSAPSIPIKAQSSDFSGSSNSVTLDIPTLRLTYKPNVKILIFRWSAAQQNYFQVTSITTPLLNDTTVDSVQFVDQQADSDIIGNSLIYTTGGVLENTPGPACTALTLFDTRLFSINAEDQNLLNISKQVIEGVPVEISDLLSLYIAPNAGATTSTGPMRCLAPMDDKLIIFKGNALFYMNGSGPDNTGANSQYSQPIFITSTVGSRNQKSIILVPGGLMFQSDKGIWLLGRDLSTTYIGAAVEGFNSETVNSANAIPGTNMVVFTLSNGVTLMYDYYYNEWGTFEGVPAVSSTICQGAHTTISDLGIVSQQAAGTYLDNGNPVLMRFKTGWINLAALMGFQRFYDFTFVGQYFSPHKLNVKLAYNYVDTTVQNIIITPNNFSTATASPFGDQSAPFGAKTDLEQWRISPRYQKCQAFQIAMDELFDPSLGAAAGAGLSISGLNMMTRIKKTSRPLRATQTAG